MCGNSDGAVVWGIEVCTIGANGSEVRGSASGFPDTGNKVKFIASEGRVVAEGGGKNSPSGSRDTAAPDIFGQETYDSSRLGGPKAYF